MSGVGQTLGTLQWLRPRRDTLDSTETDAHFPSGHACGRTAAGKPGGVGGTGAWVAGVRGPSCRSCSGAFSGEVTFELILEA